MTHYSVETVSAHIRRKHPGCPEFAVEWFASEIASKIWKRASLGKVVGITMQTHLRHHHTEYDTLLLLGIDRREARRRVQPRVNAIIRSWSKRKPHPLNHAGQDTHEKFGGGHGG